METLVVTERHVRDCKTGGETRETAYHYCSASARSRTARQWAEHVRDHWGIESRNHGRRDNWLLEDKTRSKHSGIVASLCILRSVVLHFNAQTETGNVNAFVESCQGGGRHALGLIMRRRGVK
jgi:predicted transposase YbfD/YdcC